MALRGCGIEDSAYSSGAAMFDLIHQARVDGKDPATYLRSVKGIVPILKIDNGLEAEARS